MHASLQTKVYVSTCIAASAYAAYLNPARWVTWYTLGALAGLIFSRSAFRAAREGHQPKFIFCKDETEDQKIRQNAIKSLVNSMPGIGGTAINLLALGLISQKVQLPSGWNPAIEAVICILPVITSGTTGAVLFYFNKLLKDQNPKIQELLEKTTI